MTDICTAGGGYPGDHNGTKFAALLAAARAYIEAAEKEAKAQLTLSNAEANFSNPEPERQRAIEAIGAAGVAYTALRKAVDAHGVKGVGDAER